MEKTDLLASNNEKNLPAHWKMKKLAGQQKNEKIRPAHWKNEKKRPPNRKNEKNLPAHRKNEKTNIHLVIVIILRFWAFKIDSCAYMY